MLKQKIILYPCDYFNHSIADDIFEQERQIAESVGFETALFDFDTFELIGTRRTNPFSKNTQVVYRGWHVSVDVYKNKLYPLLCELGQPLVSPCDYACMHTTDNYITYIQDIMLPSVSLSYNELIEAPEKLLDIASVLSGSLFVKDGVKSVYGHTRIDFVKYDKRELEVGMREIEYIKESRGRDFTGTLIFKPFVNIDEQFRAFIINGQLGIALAHDSQWSGVIPDSLPLDLPSPFYTVDMGHNAESEEWFVVECGDGQVSDIDESKTNIVNLYKKLAE